MNYNGWSNWETWNISLWISNDEPLYHLSQQADSYQGFIDCLTEIGITETPDGCSFSSPELDIEQIEEHHFSS